MAMTGANGACGLSGRVRNSCTKIGVAVMTYFSRLSDIVTCNLNELVAREEDPQAAILSIIREIEAGVAGANRSVATATSNQQRIQAEIDEHLRQVEH